MLRLCSPEQTVFPSPGNHLNTGGVRLQKDKQLKYLADFKRVTYQKWEGAFLITGGNK
jgi:hypothetical protein